MLSTMPQIFIMNVNNIKSYWYKCSYVGIIDVPKLAWTTIDETKGFSTTHNTLVVTTATKCVCQSPKGSWAVPSFPFLHLLHHLIITPCTYFNTWKMLPRVIVLAYSHGVGSGLGSFCLILSSQHGFVLRSHHVSAILPSWQNFLICIIGHYEREVSSVYL